MASNVSNAIRILELLPPHPEGLRITDLSARLGANKAVAHRLLRELIVAGYVAQDPVTERYHATFRLGALGLQQLDHAGINSWAQRPLDKLAGRTRELVRLGVVTGHSLNWIAKAQGSNSSLIIDPASGRDVALHATATGKAWLSTLSDEEVDSLLGERGMEALTDATIVDRETLKNELKEARRRGFAMVEEEIDLGVSAVAAPIFQEYSHVAVGTVSVAGPTSRLDRHVLESFAGEVVETARELGRLWVTYQYATTQAARGRAWPKDQGGKVGDGRRARSGWIGGRDRIDTSRRVSGGPAEGSHDRSGSGACGGTTAP